MSEAEFSRPVPLNSLGLEPRRTNIEASLDERAALARRFDLVAIESLRAEAALCRNGDDVIVEGRIEAKVTQSCVATGVPLGASVDKPFSLVFRPQPQAVRPDEEVELREAEMDVVFYDGGCIDFGEGVAETLALSLDPYPRAPEAAAALKAAGVKSEEEAGPFGALAGLKDKLEKK